MRTKPKIMAMPNSKMLPCRKSIEAIRVGRQVGSSPSLRHEPARGMKGRISTVRSNVTILGSLRKAIAEVWR